jgi:TfoX/Sxy family transcriptional regulator of competence genes
MGSDQGFVDYVVDQLRRTGEVSARKMFGEFAIYQDGRIVALVCDNQLYLKPTTGGRAFIGEPTEAPPYPGSKPWFQVTDRVDDGDWLTELFVITAREVPAPTAKKTRKAKSRKR